MMVLSFLSISKLLAMGALLKSSLDLSLSLATANYPLPEAAAAAASLGG